MRRGGDCGTGRGSASRARYDFAVRHAGALAGWFFVIFLFVLMTIWAARESVSAGAFMGTCLGLLIIVPLLVRQRR